MLKVLKENEVNDKLWDDFLKNNNGNFLQSSLWGKLKSEFGWSYFRVLVLENNLPVSGAQILIKKIYNFLTIAYIPRGPIGEVYLDFLIKEIINLTKEKGADFLKIEPQWEDKEDLLISFNFKKGKEVQLSSTIILDISDDIDKILNKKVRYEIRKAKENGIKVKYGTIEDIENFYFIFENTSKVNNFPIRPMNYYRKILEIFKDKVLLIFAEYESKLIGTAFILCWNDTIYYLYAGTLKEYKFLPISYVLHEAAILWGKSLGCKKYDLWGISNKMPGVNRFKKNFGGRIVNFIGAWDLPFSKFKYKIFRFAEKFLRG